MAFLIPENIPSRSSVPDRLRQVARSLRDFMPDNITVWLNDKQEGAPYLELLDPDGGILVIDAPLITTTRKRRPRWRPFSEEDLVGIRNDIASRADHLRRRIDRTLVRSLPVETVLAAPEHDEVPIAALGPGREGLPILTRSDLTENRPAARHPTHSRRRSVATLDRAGGKPGAGGDQPRGHHRPQGSFIRE